MTCEICGLEIKADRCKECTDMNEKIDNLINNRPENAYDYLFIKTAEASVARVRSILKPKEVHDNG